jgi:N-acetylmuramoyl-L-alanine amidase
MITYRVFVSASNQKANVGVGQYGTEQDRMHILADRVKFWLETQKGKFIVFRNPVGCTLAETIKMCNNLACDIFLEEHSDAGRVEDIAGDGGSEGTTVFYYTPGGVGGKSYQFATIIYKHLAPISPGKDRGVLPDTSYGRTNGLYVIRKAKPPAILIENIFHTNHGEVQDMIASVDKYAKAQAKAICEYFGEKWQESLTPEQSVIALVDAMVKKGIVSSREYWIDVLLGKIPANPEWLQVAFKRSLS